MNDKPNKQHEQRLIVVLVLLLLALCAANLWFGSVQIPASAVWDILCGKEPEKEVWKFIVLESRLPQMVAALLSGAALAVAGLLLQTAFNNPLAGPSILGIDTGASLGVALVMLFWGGTLGVSEATTLTGFTAVIAGAFLGSVTVLGTILFFSTIVKNNIMLLIVGIMVGYITSSVISLLNYFATAEGVHSYTIWGMGNFSGVTGEQLPYFALFVSVGLIIAILLIKPLNALLLGDRYAANLGVNIKLTRNLLLIVTGLLTGIDHGILRPHFVYRSRRSSYRPTVIGDIEPQHLVADDFAVRSRNRIAVQSHLYPSGRIGHPAHQCHHSGLRCAGDYLCHHQPTKNPIFQLMEEQANILSAQQLCIGYKTGHGHVKQVHGDLSFSLRKGELTCLLGANGSGKSTLLRTLSASQPSLSGKILLNGNELSAMSEREISRQIGVVLTDKTQTGGLTVYELVALGRQPHTGFFGKLDRQDRQVVDEAIEAVGISHKAHSYMAQLSDGEKQKAMIAKVLAQECPLVILDEPTAFLDVVSRIEIMTLLHHIATTQNKAILLSTHDIEQALVLADCLWLLRKGHGMRSGITEDLILNGELDTLFDRKEICFDRAHGSYYPSVQWEKEIVVECDGRNTSPLDSQCSES